LQGVAPPTGQARQTADGQVHQALLQVEQADTDAEPCLTLLDEEVAMSVLIPLPTQVCKKCCCLEHCKLNNHHTRIWDKANLFTKSDKFNTFLSLEMVAIIDDDYEYHCENMMIREQKNMMTNQCGNMMTKEMDSPDTITELIMNVNVNLDQHC
jgi:hypothetical protein